MGLPAVYRWKVADVVMAKAKVSLRLNRGAIARLFLSDDIANNMFVRGLRVETAAKVELSSTFPQRVDTGHLRASITTRRITRRGRRGAAVGTGVKYAMWVHMGTGIYGPRHALIFPRRASVLRFRPKGSKGYVFARYVRGMKANYYLLKALPAARLP